MLEVISVFLTAYPLLGLGLVSFIVTVVGILTYKYATDQDIMKSLKEEIKMLSNEAKKAKDTPEKMMELNKKAMEKNMSYMMHSFKPMMITMIPFGLFFIWLSKIYNAAGPINIIFFSLSWFWVYIIFSIIFNMILRKLLKVY